MTENELLQDCLQRLNAGNVAYYLTGSMASNYWGVPRSTHDLDFVIQLLHKLLWHQQTPSERQLLDAAGILSVQQERLDVAYLSIWPAKLHVEDLLAQIQSGAIRPKTT